MSKKKGYLSKLIWITNIFEKEIVIFIYYSLFTFISFNEGVFNTQYVFFGIGTFLQIYLKLQKKFYLWNNFTSCLFFILGSVLSYNNLFFFTGFFIFLFIISLLSFFYEKWHENVQNKFLSAVFNFLYSAIVLASFPLLYFIFMKNKLNIDLREFFQDQDHFIVFSGYFVFYLLLLLNKQLLALQTTLLKNKNKI